MSSDRDCPDCGKQLERMTLQGTDAVGSISLVSEERGDGLFGSVTADEIRTPVPYVCPECRRTLFYAEK